MACGHFWILQLLLTCIAWLATLTSGCHRFVTNVYMCLITVPTVGTECVLACVWQPGGDSASHVIQCEYAKHVVLLQAACRMIGTPEGLPHARE